jgi:hypothetical protein
MSAISLTAKTVNDDFQHEYTMLLSDQISKLHNLIALDIGENSFDLMFRGKPLQETETFSNSGITNEKTIFVIKGQPQQIEINVLVQGPNGSTINLHVSPTDTIKSLKEKISEKIDIQPNFIFLMCQGRVLENDNRTIQSYGIQKGTQIYYLLRLVGEK